MSDASSTKSEIATHSNEPKQAPDISFVAMVNLFQVQERKLEIIAKQFEQDPAAIPEAPFLDLQTEIMDMASNAHAKTFDDLYLKMMLWYQDTPQMTNTDNLTRADRLLLSVLEDLSQLSELQIDKLVSRASRTR